MGRPRDLPCPRAPRRPRQPRARGDGRHGLHDAGLRRAHDARGACRDGWTDGAGAAAGDGRPRLRRAPLHAQHRRPLEARAHLAPLAQRRAPRRLLHDARLPLPHRRVRRRPALRRRLARPAPRLRERPRAQAPPARAPRS